MELNDHSSRAHALLAASSAHRWLNCTPSAVAAAKYPNTETDYTREGTIAHEVAEMVARDGCSSCVIETDGITSEMKEHAQEYSDYIREQIHDENALVMLEQRVDFSPWVPGGFGTADCIIIQGKTMDVIDYKYGKGVAVSAIDNDQEKLYGLGALNDYGFAYDIDTIRLHIFQPRINNISISEISVKGLLEWAERIKPLALAASTGKGKYAPGTWCKFCPHAGKCRALTNACTEIVETHGLRARIETLAPHEIAEVLTLEPMISSWLKRVKDQALTDMLNGQQVPGFKVVAGRSSRSWEDEEVVKSELLAGGLSLFDIQKTELLSVSAMEKALGKKKVAEIVGDKITILPGAPTIAPESDKRPAYDRVAEAKKDFE